MEKLVKDRTDAEKAILSVLELEGGYSNHRYDTGGKTMYGITERVARKHGYTGPMKLIPINLVLKFTKNHIGTLIRAMTWLN